VKRGEGAGKCPIRFGAGGGRKGYKDGEGRRQPYLPGRGRSVVRMADGLGDPFPLHYGAGDPSIFLLGAYTSLFVAAGARVRAAPTN